MTSADFLTTTCDREKAKETGQDNNGEWAKWEKPQVVQEEEKKEASRKPESGRDYDRVREITRITVDSVGLSLSREEGCD